MILYLFEVGFTQHDKGDFICGFMYPYKSGKSHLLYTLDFTFLFVIQSHMCKLLFEKKKDCRFVCKKKCTMMFEVEGHILNAYRLIWK